jgi:hypothetical protein
MDPDKDIKFPEKKIDDSWKEQIQKEHQRVSDRIPTAAGSKSTAPGSSPQKKSPPSLKPFVNLLSSLGFQALVHLGEIAAPGNPNPDINLEAAKEMIELIAALKEKTEGNRSPEENEMILALLTELQMKFAQKV